MEDIETVITARYGARAVALKAGDLLFRPPDALDVVDECERRGAAILGLDFWIQTKDGIMETSSTAWDDINQGEGASTRTVTEARQLIKSVLPENADYVSFVLEPAERRDNRGE